MSLKEAILLGLALNFIAGGVVGFLTGPIGFLTSIGIGFVLLTVVYFFFHNTGLVIHYAGHGLGPEQYTDVTAILKGQIRDDKLNIVIDCCDVS